MTLARSGLLAVAVSLLVVACGGRSIGDDLSGTPTPTDAAPPGADAGPDSPTGCTFNGAKCDEGDVPVADEAACGDAVCYSRQAGCPGSLLWCAHRNGPQCDAVPLCDNGDTQVKACPDGGPNSGLTCYPRTLCGSTIQCVHHDACTGLPSCQPGDIEVTNITTCSMKGVDCYAVTECNYTIHCYTP